MDAETLAPIPLSPWTRIAAWARTALPWSGLVLGWIALNAAPSLPSPESGPATAFGWLAVILAWTQVSPCARGACARPAAPGGKTKEG